MAQLRAVEQTAFVEQVIEDDEIAQALEDREKKASLDAVRKVYDGANEHAMLKLSEVVWAKTNGLPESVQDRLHVRDEVIFRFTLREKAYFDVDAIRAPYAVASIVRDAKGRAPTFAGKKAAAPGQPSRTRKIWTGRAGDEHRAAFHREGRIRPDGKNPGNVWPMATASRPGNDFAHFAMFPPELVRRPILSTVPPGGVVLDPFAGTGTTAVVANELLRRAVLIELDPASIEAIKVRCASRSIAQVPA